MRVSLRIFPLIMVNGDRMNALTSLSRFCGAGEYWVKKELRFFLFAHILRFAFVQVQYKLTHPSGLSVPDTVSATFFAEPIERVAEQYHSGKPLFVILVFD
jgi:hypothetical protein